MVTNGNMIPGNITSEKAFSDTFALSIYKHIIYLSDRRLLFGGDFTTEFSTKNKGFNMHALSNEALPDH
jgi:hypothetical protein